MRSLLLLVAAATLSAEAPPPTDLDRYEQALSAFHFNEASIVVDKLIHQRVPNDGKPRPDPVLNALIGRIYLAVHHVAEAAIYLDNAPIAELPPSMRAPTALDHARALDLRGDRAAALVAFREAASASQNDDQLRNAQIGIARELLAANPAAVGNEVLPIASGAPEPQRWAARYLLALSSSLLGDSASARKWADAAWTDAASAPLTDLAPIRVETLRAGLAAAAHDTNSERAMLMASNGLAVSASHSLSAQLPVCGDAGLRQSDFVIFGYVAGPFHTLDLIPIAASRSEAVPPFARNLDGTAPIKEVTGDAPIGTVFTVRCRSVVNSDFVANQNDVDPLVAWSVEQGLYPASVSDRSDDEDLKKVEDWIDSLGARFGKDSPLLIMPRAQVMTMLEARAHAGDPVLPGQLADIRTDIATALRHGGAPEWLAASIEFRTEVEHLVQTASGSDPTTEMQGLFRKQLLKEPFSLWRPFLSQELGNIDGEWPASVSQLVIDLNSKTLPSLELRERQAWQLTVANALHSMAKHREAQEEVTIAGLPKDICLASDSEPKLLEQHFSYNDYPQDLIAGEQEGAVMFEFGLTPAGAVADPRITYSLPSGLFDQVSRKGFTTVRYTPPTRGGKARACRAVYQPIVWRLDSGSNFTIPVMNPEPIGPVT